jgi:peroxiredoxin
MKKIILVSIIFLTLHFSIMDLQGTIEPVAAAGFEITVKPAVVKGKYLYLARRISGNYIKIDSAQIKGLQTVVLKGSVPAPEMLFLFAEDPNKLYPLFVENDNKIAVNLNLENTEYSTVKGSSLHDLYQTFKAGQNKLTDYQQAKVYAVNFIRKHPDSFLSPYILRREVFFSLSLSEIKELSAVLDKSLESSPYLMEVKDLIISMEKVDIGKPYTDFSMPSPNGNMVSLSDFTGAKLLLVDFWASWCGPCRRENPNVVKLYNDYKDKGFDIVGVSLDNNKENWLKGIREDGLVWHHMSDLKGWQSEGSKLYGIVSIPGTILIDGNGTIIARNLKGEELREKVKSILE